MQMQNVHIEFSEPEFCQRPSSAFEFSPHVEDPLIGRNVKCTGESLFEIAQLGGKRHSNLNMMNAKISCQDMNDVRENIDGKSTPKGEPTCFFAASDVRTTVNVQSSSSLMFDRWWRN
jgi:hypothetical protein